MILVDSSAWIDFLAGRETAWTHALTLGSDRLETIILGDLVLAEILQGFKHERDVSAALQVLQRFPVVDLCGQEIARRAAENYRVLRRRGVTIRGTIDVVIATWCIEHHVAIMEAELGLMPYAPDAP